MISTQLRRSLASLTLLAVAGLPPVPAAAQAPAIPGSAAERMAGPRDPGMQRIVAELERAAEGVTRQFRADLAGAVTKCKSECEPAAFARMLAKHAALAGQQLTAALKAADRQLKERAGALVGADRVLGAPGDLSRAVAGLEMESQRASAEMTESLAELKGAGFGGQPLLTTLQIRLVSLVNITPITLLAVLTVHVSGSPTGYVFMDGHAPADSMMTIVITCGGAGQTLHATANDDGAWDASANVPVPSSKTCTMTATGTGIGTGSINTEIHFP